MTEGEIFWFGVWGIVTCVPTVYLLLNFRRIRHVYILPDNATTPYIRDPLFILWAAVTMTFLQLGVYASIVGWIAQDFNVQRCVGGFILAAPLVGWLMALASDEVSWQKPRGDHLLNELRQVYTFFVYCNPIGVGILLYRGLRKFFLPCRA